MRTEIAVALFIWLLAAGLVQLHAQEKTSPEKTGPEKTGPEKTGPEKTGPEATRSESTKPDTIRKLVKQLGDLEYGMRESAVQKLVAIGYPAIDIISEAVDHPDREIRVRARRVLTLIREVDFQRRLAAFMMERNAKNSHGLPGWEIVRGLFADAFDDTQELALRELFVEMQREEPDLMRSLENPKANARDDFSSRVQQIRQAFDQYGETCSVGSFASIMVLAAQQASPSNQQVNAILFQICRQDLIKSAVLSGNKKVLLRKLIGNWIAKCDSWLIPQALVLAHDYHLVEGLVMAENVLVESQLPGRNSYQFDMLQYAIFVISKMGSEKHIPLLETLFTNTSTRLNLQRRAVEPDFQVRDIALLTTLKLSRKNPADFGYRETVIDDPLAGSQTVWFLENDVRRVEAIELWKASKADAKNTEPNKP